MLRVLSIAAFLAAIAMVSDCQAQRPRGFFNRSARIKSASIHNPIRQQPYKFEASQYSQTRNSLVSRILDGPSTPRYRDPAEVDSRYIGGFHQSHFDNIGIPTGDIGLRGNGFQFRPW
jgi:hypothetical protein